MYSDPKTSATIIRKAFVSYMEHKKNRRPLLGPFLLTVYSVQGTLWYLHLGIALGENKLCHLDVVVSPFIEKGNTSCELGIQSAKSFGENDKLDDDAPVDSEVESEEERADEGVCCDGSVNSDVELATVVAKSWLDISTSHCDEIGFDTSRVTDPCSFAF